MTMINPKTKLITIISDLDETISALHTQKEYYESSEELYVTREARDTEIAFEKATEAKSQLVMAYGHLKL